MQKIAFMACLLTLTPLCADNAQDVQAFISYEEWKEITCSSEGKEDCIVLIDGTRIPAALTKLPSLSYNFVKMEFDVNEIKTIAVVNQPEEVKLQYITREGQNYIGKLAQGKFVFWVSEPSMKDPSHMVEKEVDPKLVNFIVLADRESKITHSNPQLSSLELKNGDHLPVTLMSNPILLTNGWSEKKIRAEKVLELCFDGGVHGKLIDNGEVSNLGFMYVKDPYLMIQIPRNQFLVKLPWSQITHIQGFNGGFRQNNVERELFQPAYFQDETVQFEIGNLLTAHQNEQPARLGITNGDLLTGALCATAIPPNSIAEVERLGLDTLIALEAIFDPEENTEFFDEIALEDFEDPMIAMMVEAMVEDIIAAPMIAMMEEAMVEAITAKEEGQIEAIAVKPDLEITEDPMVLDNEFDIFDDLTEPQETDWMADVSFEDPQLNFDIDEVNISEFMETPISALETHPATLVGIDELYINDEDEVPVGMETPLSPLETPATLVGIDELYINDEDEDPVGMETPLSPLETPATLVGIDELYINDEDEDPVGMETPLSPLKTPGTLVGIDELYINDEDEDPVEDVLWVDSYDEDSPLSPDEEAFIEEFLAGSPAR